MARSGVLRRSEFTGESPRTAVSSEGVAFCFSGVGGGIADLVRVSHSWRSSLSLQSVSNVPHDLLSVEPYLSSSRSSSIAFAALAMFRGLGFFRRATCCCGSSSRENQSLSIRFETRSCDSSSCMIRASSNQLNVSLMFCWRSLAYLLATLGIPRSPPLNSPSERQASVVTPCFRTSRANIAFVSVL